MKKINDFSSDEKPCHPSLRCVVSIALLKEISDHRTTRCIRRIKMKRQEMMIYPCVNVVLLGDDIRRLIESFSKEEVDSKFDEDEAAISGIIEDMPE